jgi:hypothetical protein
VGRNGMKIKKQVLSEQRSDFILKETIYNNFFPWYYLHNSANVKKIENSFNYSWYHSLFVNGKITSPFFKIFEKDIFNILKKFNLEHSNLVRVRFGKTVSIGKKYINDLHVDQKEKHKTILYYVNNSDGDTYFYKNDGKTIISKITPEQNKAVLFNGLTFHASSKPVKNMYRIVLNINITDF